MELFEKTWKEVVGKALQKCSQRVRKKDTTVVFPERIIHEGDGDGIIMPLGSSHRRKLTTRPIAISLEGLRGYHKKSTVPLHLAVLHLILHELFEEDYWEKPKNKKREQRSHNDPKYGEAEHEDVSDKRALSHLNETLGVNLSKVE